MGKIGKVIGIIVLLVVGVIAGLTAFVHYYLTEERVKGLVIQQAETALDRQVAIGDIKIGLFSGITIKDFSIKEADGKDNFVSTRAFVLNYELLPLLKKKLIISEIRFDEPAVQILRAKNGKFNFSSLAILNEKTPQKTTEKSTPASAGLPLALTINQIRLNDARIKIRDQLDKIPAVDATANTRLNVKIGRTLEDLQYKGSFDFAAAASYGSAKTDLNGKGTIQSRTPQEEYPDVQPQGGIIKVDI